MSSRSCEAGSANGCALAEHQRQAVERLQTILSRYGGAILADEPGLGKSFVAAELARARPHCEFIVPASLVPQWKGTLRDFGVSATITTHDRITAAVPAREAERRLIVVDEAHAFRNPRTKRYDALARRSVGAQLLLVTATPVCNAAADLQALLNLIVADDALSPLGVPSVDAAFEARDRHSLAVITAELVVRRARDVLPERLQFGSLSRRIVRFEPFTGGGKVAAIIDSLRFPLIGETALLRHFLWRRLISSESALLESLRRQRRFYSRALECLASGRALPKQAYRRLFGREEDAAAFQTVLFWDMFVAGDVSADAAQINAEVGRLDALGDLVARSPRHKRAQLVDLCTGMTEPVLIFTAWAATAIELFETLKHVRRTALVTGRERLRGTRSIDAFRAGHVDVLVCTDLAAEGLNLQRAGAVVHYDVPWNPVRLDQRNGRAHRIGQRRDRVTAYYFLSSDDAVFRTVARKKRITKALSVQGPALNTGHPTMRPRVTSSSAIVLFKAAVEASGLSVPAELARRHKAGLERLLVSLSRGRVDRALLQQLVPL